MKRTIAVIAFLSVAIFIANIPASISVGVNGRYSKVRMPLYVKWIQFLGRHYEYARLSKEITKGCGTDEAKALAVLSWTRQYLKDVPRGMPLCDDHILYTIIRGYAVPEQFQDVFTTLCAYSGIPAFFGKPYDKSSRIKYAISLVKLKGKWRVFDAYYGIYFRNKAGEIASVDDIRNDPSLIKGKGIEDITIEGVPYKDVYYNLSDVHKPAIIRPERQMPFPRILYEARKALKIDKGDNE